MRIRLLAGRAFTSHDDASSPPVAMVSASTASRLWPGSQAVGRRMRLFRGGGNPWITVVGVVANTRTRQLRETLLDVYVPASQTDTGVPAWIVRTTDDPLREGAAIRAAIRQVDPTRAVDISTLERRVEDAMRPWRFATLVLGAFAALALALAVTGVHGLLAYSVLLQQKEFGIRVALGAAPRRIAAIVARRVSLVTMAGIVAGVTLAFSGGRAMTGLLFGVTPLDVTSLAAAVIMLGAAVAVAAAAPAHRAASADPIVALRETL
ncbi:MAG: hypothetical protein DMF86_09120 [Acidobacteria bacterium]|nr:MAG: hypothetical protein DMF86_09120 [Acidobacteriota bacterium]